MTSLIRSHIIFNTDLLYSYAHFVFEIDEKSSHNGGFEYDLVMISDSGLLFWATLYMRVKTAVFESCRSLLIHAMFLWLINELKLNAHFLWMYWIHLLIIWPEPEPYIRYFSNILYYCVYIIVQYSDTRRSISGTASVVWCLNYRAATCFNFTTKFCRAISSQKESLEIQSPKTVSYTPCYPQQYCGVHTSNCPETAPKNKQRLAGGLMLNCGRRTCWLLSFCAMCNNCYMVFRRLLKDLSIFPFLPRRYHMTRVCYYYHPSLLSGRLWSLQ